MILYSKEHAQKGKLYKLFIKDVIIPEGSSEIPLYVDLNNSYWNAGDIVNLAEAEALRRAYYQGIGG